MPRYPYPCDPAVATWCGATTIRSPDGDLLLSPWWIAAIVAAGVIILMIVCVFCMFMCRPGPGWGGRGNRGAGVTGNFCFDPETWLACCVMLSLPRRDQPYRRRRRQIYYSGSVDRPAYRGDDELSGYSGYSSRFPDDISYMDDEPHIIVSDQYYVEPSPSELY